MGDAPVHLMAAAWGWPSRQEETSAVLPRRPARARRARAFTLIELIVTMGLSVILGLGFLSVVVWQTKLSTQRLGDTDARQQANAVLLALRNAGGQVGYGFGHALDAAGLPATGTCLNASSYGANWSRASTQSKCAAIDNAGRNDRVRFSYIDPWVLSFASVPNPSAGVCKTGSGYLPDVTRLHFTAPAQVNTSQAHGPLPVNNQVVQASGTTADFRPGVPLYIGGLCQGGGTPSAGTDQLVLLSNPASQTNDCAEVYPFARRLPSFPEDLGLSCPGGYAPGFACGLAEVTEFYTATDPLTGLPQLMMAQQAWGQAPVVVAKGVTRFEVRYGIATSAAPSNVLLPCPSCVDDPYGTAFGGPRTWCREVRGPDQGGSCNLTDSNGVALSTAALQQRVIAMHVIFDIVSPEQPDQVTAVVGLPVGAPTWTYQTTMYLKNMLL